VLVSLLLDTAPPSSTMSQQQQFTSQITHQFQQQDQQAAYTEQQSSQIQQQAGQFEQQAGYYEQQTGWTKKSAQLNQVKFI
jgi:hypothetical protein